MFLKFLFCGSVKIFNFKTSFNFIEKLFIYILFTSLYFIYIYIFFFALVLIYIYLTEINGFADDMYGDVTPIEIISSVGSLWNFGPGHQDAHELFHVVLSALDAEIQPANRVCD